MNEIARQREQLDQLTTLDQLHAIAIKHSIVTPYSSMLVLVNTRQEQLLQDLENDADRFNREVEPVGETEGLSVTGVPEPEEWLLIIVGLLMLAGYTYYLRRQT